MSLLEALLLGSAQDGGVPQAGCRCAHCAAARLDPTQRRLVACLALIDRRAGASWLIDATPDVPRQFDALAAYVPDCPLAGIILTHAHIGHYTGLIHLGREVMGARAMPLYTTASMAAFLRGNGPWSQLVALGNVALRELTPDAPLELSPDLIITPIRVPHRAEFSDTIAVLAEGSQRRMFYCPDIDRWEPWDRSLRALLTPDDLALLDGTFFSGDELPGRNLAEIPHPLVTDTVALLAGSRISAGFIHLNHSNPLLHPGPEAAWLADQGHWVGREGMAWAL